MGRALALALFACVFLVVAVVLAGVNLLMLCCIAYVPGIAFYVMARREYKAETVMTGAEKALAAFIVIVAAAAITLLATGVFSI